ncbi:DUF3040 domain-containing protein [Actinomycetospora atypica]|uniref:DUF3040 domain-containing protein n=1 Tax=Actinomycetospora atypica TaxID=1290095 RepID=A0ABV9YG78_9PSEU
MPSIPPDPTPLTREEQALLAAIAAHEHRVDARFATALAAGVAPRSRRRGPVLLVLALVAVVAAPLVLTLAWLLAIAAVALLVVVPTALVVWSIRQGRVDPDGI